MSGNVSASEVYVRNNGNTLAVGSTLVGLLSNTFMLNSEIQELQQSIADDAGAATVQSSVTLPETARTVHVGPVPYSVTLTLPPASEFPPFKTLTIVDFYGNAEAYPVTLLANGNDEFFDGETSYVCDTNYFVATLRPLDNGKWLIS